MKVAQDENTTTHPDFWNNPKKAEEILKEIKLNKFWVNSYDNAWKAAEDVAVMREFYEAGEATDAELKEAYQRALAAADDLEFRTTLSQPEDQLCAVLEINAGAGGTESCDW